MINGQCLGTASKPVADFPVTQRSLEANYQTGYTYKVITMPVLFGHIAALLAVVQAIPYIWSILRGRTRPSRTSYGIWAVMQVIGLISYVAAGATTTVWMMLVLSVTAIVIFGLSFKYGMGGFNTFDMLCLLMAGGAIALWQITNSPALAVYMSTLAGAIGYLPTIKKAYLQPHTENVLAWCIYVAATVLNVCALTSLSFTIALPPVVTACLAVTVASLLLMARTKPQRIRRKLA